MRGQPIKWDYDRAEILADGIVHGLGIVSGLVAVTTLIILAAQQAGPWELTSVLIYGGSLITQMKGGVESLVLLVGVWTSSLVGMTLKLCFPGRFDRLSIVLYLLISWSGVMAYQAVLRALPTSSLWLLALGGVLYTAGVVFHLWQSLRFQNAIWHAFVLVAAACHFRAVLDCIVLTRA